MGRGLTPPARSWIATLCVALAVVFAATSAVGVVDRVQHAAQTPHEHDMQLTLIAGEDNHQPDHQSDGDRDNSGQSPNDHQTGPGHHHVDGPTGSINNTGETDALVLIVSVSQPYLGDACARGVRPGGLERPPKAIATRV